MKKTEKFSALRNCIRFIQNHKKDLKEEEFALTIEDGEKPFVISDDRIFKVPKVKEYRKLGIVDGGTEPLIKASDFNISICRVAGITLDSEKLSTPEKLPPIVEFYSATISEETDKGEIVFRTSLFPKESSYNNYMPQEDILIPLKDPSLRMQGKFLMPIENHGGIAMRFTEWTYAKHFILNELGKGDIFIRDGSLQTGYPKEIRLANEVYSAGINKNVYITGLSKSCRLLNQSGNSLNFHINLIGNSKFPQDPWYYYPIKKITRVDNQADLFFVKFNKDSPYSFRFDIYIEQSNNLSKQEREIIISNIANNSNDPAFLGYPYGLIKVDQLARISKKEIESYKIQLLIEFDKDIFNKFILPRLRSIDAHDILNKIRK
ncbi:MAG: hypothetical protein ACFFAF_11480 [Candidatus Hermodarchaeota archaeon]